MIDRYFDLSVRSATEHAAMLRRTQTVTTEVLFEDFNKLSTLILRTNKVSLFLLKSIAGMCIMLMAQELERTAKSVVADSMRPHG